MKFQFSFDGVSLGKVKRNLHTINVNLENEGGRSAWNNAQMLKSRSQAVVPYQDGDLYNSAYITDVSPSKSTRVWAVGYNTILAPHGWLVHETPDRQHPTRGPSPEPKQDHFLSEPAEAMREEFPRTVASDLVRAIRRTRLER